MGIYPLNKNQKQGKKRPKSTPKKWAKKGQKNSKNGLKILKNSPKRSYSPPVPAKSGKKWLLFSLLVLGTTDPKGSMEALLCKVS